MALRNRLAPMLPESCERSNWKEKTAMLTTIAILLLVLWALGLVTATTLGGYIHVLLIAAIAMVLIRIIQGRRIM